MPTPIAAATDPAPPAIGGGGGMPGPVGAILVLHGGSRLPAMDGLAFFLAFEAPALDWALDFTGDLRLRRILVPVEDEEEEEEEKEEVWSRRDMVAAPDIDPYAL